ncbi:MAG: metallophosphoesterase [Clostridia bacterium]|nr:metallophosphoesterase [Clostridia bacterium]
MFYVISDTHALQYEFWKMLYEVGENDFTDKDYVIVCGDFAYTMSQDGRDETFLRVLSEKPYTICFVDGNHENFARINSLPVEEWNGGKVHKLKENVIHLMRGQVFTIDQKRIFTFGGGFSIDKELRVLGITYFEEEMPTQQEFDEGISNLSKFNNTVDYIFTHTVPTSLTSRLLHLTNRQKRYGEERLNDYLETIKNTVAFKKWYFGHWHLDSEIDEKFIAVYRKTQIIE